MKGILLQDFFEIISQEETENKLNTVIKLKPNHRIFEGHFPNRPIVPGVCILQMVKEILMQKMQRSLMMTEGSSIKYMNVIIPDKCDNILVSVTYTHGLSSLTASIVISSDTIIFCKFQISYCFDYRE
jgi:3-hydroxyacyl-[acyl-carrier-protein] dehydratase